MKRLRFSTSRLDLTGDINCPLGVFARLGWATSFQVTLAEPCEIPEIGKLVAGGFRFYDGLLEQGERLVQTPGKLIGAAQVRHGIRGPVDNGPGLRNIKSPF